MTNLRKIERAVNNGNISLRANRFCLFFRTRPKSTSIYLKLRVNKTEFTVSTGVRMPENPNDFNRATLEIKGKPLETRKLQGLRDTCKQVFTEREILGKSLDARTIYAIAVGLRGHEIEVPSLSDCLTAYLEMHQKMYESKNIGKRTLSRYTSYGKVLKEFADKIKNKNIDQLKLAIQYDLIQFLKGDKGFSHNYAIKFFQFFKSTLNYAVANEWADRNVLQHVRLKKSRKEVITLSSEELDRIKSLILTDKSAILVRDIFLAQCYTGFAYADIMELTPSHFFTYKGVPCILKPRKKNHDKGDSAFVPIFPDAQKIIVKYADDSRCKLSGKCLPYISNQKANKWLKIIGISAGVKEVMTTHIGRKTFTAYAEDMGFDLNDTATMLGHTHASMTEAHYHKRRRDPIIIKFKKIFDTVQDKDQANSLDNQQAA